MAKFTNKVVVITGITTKLEEAIVRKFAREDASMVICAPDMARLQAVVEDCVGVNGGRRDRLVTVCGDITDTSVQRRTVDKAIEAFGRLDVLVPHPGVHQYGASFESVTEESFDTFLDANVQTPFFFIQYALPHLEASKGNVVILSTIAGSAVFSGVVILSMAKAALNHMVRNLAIDLGSRGIRVNAVCPSFIEDTLNMTPEYTAAAAQAVPLNRNGTPDDVASTVLFVASEEAKFTTGQCFNVSGGREYTGNHLGQAE